jgi:hypothetical protein
MTKTDKIWVATTSLIYPRTNKTILVSREEIEDQVYRIWQSTLTPIMIEKHLVSFEDRQADRMNPSRGGNRKRYLFRTSDGVNPSEGGDFRLYCRDDSPHDGWDKTGPTCPSKEHIDKQYLYLLNWYMDQYF